MEDMLGGDAGAPADELGQQHSACERWVYAW